jgi:hypothetical protein
MQISHRRSFIGDEAFQKLTGDASRMFPNLGRVEIDFTISDIICEALKFISHAPQYLFHVRLDGHFCQSPGVVGLCAIVG